MPNVTLGDRLDDVNEGLAAKAPCRVATTENLPSLSGLLIIDTIQLAEGNRVLVKDQTDLSQNGIYNVFPDAWERADDCNSRRDMATGTRVFIWDGYNAATADPVDEDLAEASNRYSEWICMSPDPITVGTSALVFEEYCCCEAQPTDPVGPGGDPLANPVGMIVDYGGSAAPNGWFLCYGQAISRTGFPELFAVNGTTFGAGDGSTTFNLPDLRGRVTAGLDNMGGVAAGRMTIIAGTTLGGAGGDQIVTLTIDQLPGHTHTFSFSGTTSTSSFSGDLETSWTWPAMDPILDPFGPKLGKTGGGEPIVGGSYLMMEPGPLLADIGLSITGGGDHSHTYSGSGTTTTVGSGSGSSHANVQPTMMLNKIIYTGRATL